MRVVVSGGGTAGHVNPAISVAGELISRGHEVLYIGTPAGPESRLAPAAGLPFIGLDAAGFDRARPLTLISSSLRVLVSAGKAKRILSEKRIDAVVGFGGYVSLPVGMAAKSRHIPLIVHEQNSVPGLTNKTLAKSASAVGITYDFSARYFEGVPQDRIHVVGNPVRESVLKGDAAAGRALFDIPQDALFLLVFGGSLGARHLNDAIVAHAQELMARDSLYIVQSTGAKLEAEVREGLGEGFGKRWVVVPYVDAMGDVLAAADCVVSRAGATSLAEITATGKPALLVPFPRATDDHQTKNARGLADAGASILVADADLSTSAFSDALDRLLDDSDYRASLAEKTRGFGVPDATEKLADLVETTVSSSRSKH